MEVFEAVQAWVGAAVINLMPLLAMYGAVALMSDVVDARNRRRTRKREAAERAVQWEKLGEGLDALRVRMEDQTRAFDESMEKLGEGRRADELTA